MTCNIVIGNSISQLFNVPKEKFNAIQKDVSFYDMHKYFKSKSWEYARSSLLESSGHFPTGLSKRVFIACQEKGLKVKFFDDRPKPQIHYLKLPQLCDEPAPYEDQVLATNSLLNSPSGRGVIVLPSGVGKSRAMKDTIQQLGVNTLIIVPSLSLKLQVFLYLISCFGEIFVGILDKTGNNKPITVTNLDALESYPKEHLDFFDLVYFDEWHHEACETARTIDREKFSGIYYKFAQTATNFRNSKNEKILLDCIMANQTYSLSVIQAIKKKYIVPIQPLIHEIGDIPTPERFIMDDLPFGGGDGEENDLWENFKKNLDYTKVYSDWIVGHDQRTEILAKSARLFSHKHKVPTLILVKEIQHGEHFKSLLPGSEFIHGTLGQTHNFEMVQAFNRGEIPELIGTSVIGEGVDTKEAGAIILANGEKAKTRIMQNTGRITRHAQTYQKDVGFVVDVTDTGHKLTKKHSNARKRIYIKEFGIKPKMLST